MIIKKDFAGRVHDVCNEIASLLIHKNEKYGDSALDPVHVFSQKSELEGILIRIDDKLSRIKSSGGFKEYMKTNDDDDVINDLIGYLILLKLSM